MPGLRAFVTSFLFCNGRVLLLRRRDDASFAPGFWTGVGGKVHAAELGDLTAAAMREVAEETGIRSEQIHGFRLCVVLTQPEAGDVVVLAFFVGQTDRMHLGACDEGALHWVDPADLDGIPMIANAQRALAQILSERSGDGVWFGVCNPLQPDRLESIAFGPDRWLLAT